MRTLIVACAAVLPGCASLNSAGTADYHVKPFIAEDGKAYCCEVNVRNGKQMASLDAVIVKDGDKYTVVLQQRGVEAFAGQAISAGAAKSVVEAAAKAAAGSIAPIVGGAQ